MNKENIAYLIDRLESSIKQIKLGNKSTAISNLRSDIEFLKENSKTRDRK